jgi:hypothetical protein
MILKKIIIVKADDIFKKKKKPISSFVFQKSIKIVNIAFETVDFSKTSNNHENIRSTIKGPHYCPLP